MTAPEHYNTVEGMGGEKRVFYKKEINKKIYIAISQKLCVEFFYLKKKIHPSVHLAGFV